MRSLMPNPPRKLLKSFSKISALFCLLLPAVSVAQHEVYDADFSIGLTHPFSDDRQTIPGYKIIGTPQILSDRLVLTPPAPGNQRVGLWTTKASHYKEWTIDVNFRASGGERPGGSFHIWYTAGGASGNAGMESVYTSKPWDGLVVVVDSYGGYGGLRAYLNDGKTDYSIHHNIPSLAFGHCDFHYRNKGALSGIRITQAPNSFRVETDGTLCFETGQVRLPSGYHFGVSAVTSDTPDSYELFSILLSSPERMNAHGSQQQSAHGRAPHEQDFQQYNPEYQDESPDVYKTDHDQFVDLHNRLQGITHHLAAIQSQIGMLYDRVEALSYKQEEYRAELSRSTIPRSQINGMEEKLKAVENLAVQIGNTMTSKDYSKHFEALHETLENHHSSLLYSVPNTVTEALTTNTPRIGLGITLVIVFQVALVAAYVVYKRRRAGSPKKYL